MSLKQDGLFVHEPCEVSQQCTGTTNAQNCNKYKKEHKHSVLATMDTLNYMQNVIKVRDN